jgi:class 3 adenylate cyclase
LTSQQEVESISSKEILARTGISRATLNNYIALRLIPRPTVRKPDYAEGPTKIGYFPRWVLNRLTQVRELKNRGMRIPEIVAHLPKLELESSPLGPRSSQPTAYDSIHDISFPAVFVNRHWEVIWLNDHAEQVLFQKRVRDIVSATERNFLRLLLVGELSKTVVNWKEFVLAHVRLAKRDLDDPAIQEVCRETPLEYRDTLDSLRLGVEPVKGCPLIEQRLVLRSATDKAFHYTLFAGEFREGTLLLYCPPEVQAEDILDLVSARERLVRSLFAGRIPSLTSLCILAGRLESDLHLGTALPPREYFDLITQITLHSHQCIHDHTGVVGTPLHEGIVAFFLPMPASPAYHLGRALQCAQALQGEVNALDQHWKRRKGWPNTIRLNLGLHSGQEPVGSLPSSAGFQFTVIGESVPEAIKLATFARGGTMWATKRLIESLIPGQRQRIVFGIERGSHGARTVSSGIYSRVSELMDVDVLDRQGLRQIETLAVARIFSLDLPGKEIETRDAR